MMVFASTGSMFQSEYFRRHYISVQSKANRVVDENELSDDDDPSNIRQLFPKDKEEQLSSSSKIVVPEWMSVVIGLFLALAIVGVASFHAYQNGNYGQDLTSNSNIKLNDIFQDSSSSSVSHVYNQINLPDNFKPLSYIIYLYPNIRYKNLTGLVKITIECIKNTTEIVLHASRISVHEVQLKNETGAVIPVADKKRNDKKNYLIITTNETLNVSQKYDIFLGFSKKLHFDSGDGVYLTNYMDGTGNSRVMFSSMFEPRMARLAFPCFDEPQLKATFKLIMRFNRTDGYDVMSNMPVEKRIIITDSDAEVHFQTTPIMSTYLITFALTQYKFMEVMSRRGVPIRVFAPLGRLSEAKFAAQLAPLVLDYYDNLFGLNYTLPKLDLVPVSSLAAGADECWGMIIFNEDYLLYDADKVSTSWVVRIARTIAHEMSHLWFGDLVTPDSWRSLWLKESFANYMEDLPIKQFFARWDLETLFYKDDIAGPMGDDASNYTHPIYTNEEDPEKLTLNYDSITYEKGSAIVSMLSGFLGEEKFFNGVHSFLKKYAYGNANPVQFWQEMSKQRDDIDVVKMMNSWVNQPGFPIVTFKWENSKRKLEIKQEKFVQVGEAAPGSTLWDIPIFVKFEKNETTLQHLLTNNSVTLNITEGSYSWYKANYKARGYYRANYEDGNWQMLIDQFNKDHKVFSAVDRANVLSDIRAIENSGYRKINFSLEFSKYLTKEHHYIPWSFGIAEVEIVHSLFENTTLGNCSKDYILELIKPGITYLNSFSNHSFLDQQLITLLISKAAYYGYQDISLELENKFLKWMISETYSGIPASLRGSVFYIGMLHGNSDIWEKLLLRYKSATSKSEQSLILSTLTQTKNETLLAKLVNKTFAINTFGPSRYTAVLTSVGHNKRGNKVAFKAVQENWSWIYERLRNNVFEMRFLLFSCFSQGKTVDDLDKVEDFFTVNKLEKYNIFKNRIKEQITQRMKFMKREGEIEKWFRDNRPYCFRQ